MPVNDFLLRRRGERALVPAKERSLEIFGDEKRLDQMCKAGMLMGKLPLSALGCFQVAAPLPYRLADARGKPALVVENKDIRPGDWLVVAAHEAIIQRVGGDRRPSGQGPRPDPAGHGDQGAGAGLVRCSGA